MKQPDEGQVPDELEAVTARLHASRAQADPLQLDQIKQRVMTRAAAPNRRSMFMKSRMATVFSVVALLGGTGGAIAVASHGASGSATGGGASEAQYHPGKGCGDRDDHRGGPPGNPSNNSCPSQAGHGNQNGDGR